MVTRLLSISGQDAITVNRKNEKKWHGTLGVRFLILTNPLLHFTDASDVIASRFVPVQFTESFEGRENTGLTEELLEELPGIPNLAMQGLRRLRERGYFERPRLRMASGFFSDLGENRVSSSGGAPSRRPSPATILGRALRPTNLASNDRAERHWIARFWSMKSANFSRYFWLIFPPFGLR